MNCSPPGSPVHGILQARIPEWVATPSSGGPSCESTPLNLTQDPLCFQALSIQLISICLGLPPPGARADEAGGHGAKSRFPARPHSSLEQWVPTFSVDNNLKRTFKYTHQKWASLVSETMKESACNAAEPGSVPGSGRSPGEENGYPLQYSSLENGQKSLVGYNPWGRKESDTTEQLTLSFALKSRELYT